MSKPSSKDWLPKEEAAALLGVSTRQIERMAAAGKLRSQRTRLEGDRAARTVYAEADLQATRPAAPLELATRPRQSETGMRMPTSAELLAIARATAPREPRAWLTLDEAAGHSGLPAAELARLITSGDVYALGRGAATWRIQRASLDAFGAKPAKRRRVKA